MPTTESGIERQVESIRRVLRERGAQQERAARDGRPAVAAVTARVGERGPLMRAITSLMTHGTTSSVG